jgi:peptidylamidoglycolate lyase
VNHTSRSLTLALALIAWAAADSLHAQQARVPMCTQLESWAPRVAAEDTIGLVGGVTIDPQGRVVAFRRAGRPFSPVGETPISRAAVLVLNPANGEVVARWGENRFYVPHSITFDSRGNAWTADTGLHQIMSFSPDGRLLTQVGESKVSGADDRHFDQPSGVTVASDGSFYVSDGYGNTRVMHFSADGRLLQQWGAPGTGPGQFDLPHGIVLGRDGLIHVADRENGRIQSFDTSGRLVRMWDDPEIGNPYAILETAPDSQWRGLWLVSSRSQVVDGQQWSRVNIVDPASGKVLGFFGRRDRQPNGGQVPLLGHALAVDREGAVYAAGSQGLIKFTCRWP